MATGDGRSEPPPKGDGANRFVEVGHCGAPHGVKGWMRIGSDTDPRDSIFQLQPWWLNDGQGRKQVEIEAWRFSGRQAVVKLSGCDSPESAEAFKGQAIEVSRASFPPAQDDEYYWCDLVGLEVVTSAGETLGTVSELFETGSNDVMVVGQERHLVPFIAGQVVQEVDLEAARIRVDWDVDF